ncbi:antitoxin [Deltaproteobacteria bacterium]|nr:antitoxin [Deltaproteobacteria bacterium]
MEIPAGEFKARCLRLMDEVAETGRELIITKRGRPVAKLVPVSEAEAVDVFGCMRGTVTVTGDLVAPLEDTWEADR